MLIDRLLANVNSAPADDINGAADGLEQLTQTDWPKGTTANWLQTQAGRDGRPYST